MERRTGAATTLVGTEGIHVGNASGALTHIRGKRWEISLAFAIMTIPMLVFSALLLGLIHHYRVVFNGFSSTNLSFETGNDESGVFYVALSATTLTTIASWSSTVAPLLVGFAVTLASYPIARGLLKPCEQNQPQDLPTPYQLSLMIRTLSNGSFGSLWGCLKYYFRRTARRESLPPAMAKMIWILTLALVLSGLVFVTDTWLHLTTKSINFNQVEPNLPSSNASFQLIPSCLDVKETATDNCTLTMAATATFLTNGALALRVLNNISDTAIVKTFFAADGSQYAYFGPGSQNQLANIDYTATSVAVNSQCRPVAKECVEEDGVTGPYAPFNCPFAFQGRISTTYESSILMAYFTDSTGSNNQTYRVSISNPYYYAAIVSVNQDVGAAMALTQDPEISGGLHGSTIFAVFCNSTVYDLEYSSINGSITRFLFTASNSSTANIIQGSQGNSFVGDSNLMQASSVAAQMSNSSQEVADSFALAYSQTALAVAVGAFAPSPAKASQLRSTFLVARVPKAPLACLIFTNMLLVALGILLAVLAAWSAGGDTAEVQSRLSIAALVATQFEGPRSESLVENIDDLFDENHSVRGPKVGFGRSRYGGWLFTTWWPT